MKDDFELWILLLPPESVRTTGVSQVWCPSLPVLGMEPRALCLLGKHAPGCAASLVIFNNLEKHHSDIRVTDQQSSYQLPGSSFVLCSHTEPRKNKPKMDSLALKLDIAMLK